VPQIGGGRGGGGRNGKKREAKSQVQAVAVGKYFP